MSAPTKTEVVLARSILASIPAPKAPRGSPTYDAWGILNWARQADRGLWNTVPRARAAMIKAAAASRWEAHYQGRSTLREFLDYAEWLHDNLSAVTAGEGWSDKEAS